MDGGVVGPGLDAMLAPAEVVRSVGLGVGRARGAIFAKHPVAR